jgi:hippurate hydrolase
MDQRQLVHDAEALQDRTVAFRRKLHREPELGLELPKTAEKVIAEIADLPLEITTGASTTSVVAVLEGERPGPTLLLRGDMDALPLHEDTGLEFSSTNPDTMHACGHDAHTAMLAGALRLLADRRGEMAGRVLAMFQPGEEGFHGARFMLEDGLLDTEAGRQVTGAFAIHIAPPLPSGWIATRPGPLMASADEFTIRVSGRGGHASMPHQATDPVPVACEMVLALQQAVTRRVDVFDPVVLTIGMFHAGTTATNVIPSHVRLGGTIRATSAKARALAHALLGEVVEGVASAHGVTAEIRMPDGYPVTSNDAGFAALAAGVARDTIGEQKVVFPAPNPVMGAEDFCYVLEKVPGAMVFLGASPPGVPYDQIAPNHSNLMVIDEAAMPTGVALYAAVALEHLSPTAA